MPAGRPSRDTVYARLASAVAQLHQRFGGLPTPEAASAIWADIWRREAHHSTAIEGNTLALRQVAELLDTGRTVGARPLKDYLEVAGYAQAAEWVYQHAVADSDWSAGDLVTLHEVRTVHELAMTAVWQVTPHPDASDREGPGMFREHDLRSFDAGMTPPSWPLVPSAMQDWLDDVSRVSERLRGPEAGDPPLPELLARLHNGFERVHPFIDGNGRTGRLVLNLMLVRLGYPPAVILKEQRPRYLDAMQAADRGEYGPLGELIARGVYDNINRFILPAVAGGKHLVPLSALVSDEFSLAALRQAAQRGRLEAVQSPEGTWHSTAHAVERYKRNKGKHGIRPGQPGKHDS